MICAYNTVWGVVSNMFLTVKSVFYFIKTPQFLPILIFCCKYTAYIVLTGMIIIPVNMYHMYHRHTVHIYTWPLYSGYLSVGIYWRGWWNTELKTALYSNVLSSTVWILSVYVKHVVLCPSENTNLFNFNDIIAIDLIK